MRLGERAYRRHQTGSTTAQHSVPHSMGQDKYLKLLSRVLKRALTTPNSWATCQVRSHRRRGPGSGAGKYQSSQNTSATMHTHDHRALPTQRQHCALPAKFSPDTTSTVCVLAPAYSYWQHSVPGGPKSKQARTGKQRNRDRSAMNGAKLTWHMRLSEWTSAWRLLVFTKIISSYRTARQSRRSHGGTSISADRTAY